jgi:hypothetical protein
MQLVVPWSKDPTPWLQGVRDRLAILLWWLSHKLNTDTERAAGHAGSEGWAWSERYITASGRWPSNLAP